MTEEIKQSMLNVNDFNVAREHFYEAKKCVTQGKYLQAKQLLQCAIELQPNVASAYYHLGAVVVELNQLQQAIICFKKAWDIKPDVIKYKQFYKWYGILYHCKYNFKQNPIAVLHDNNKYYECNKHSIQRLINEFAPANFHLKANAPHEETLNKLNDLINLVDPMNNKDKSERYLNQKYLYKLLIHHKNVFINKKMMNIENQFIQNNTFTTSKCSAKKDIGQDTLCDKNKLKVHFTIFGDGNMKMNYELCQQPRQLFGFL